MNPYPCLDENKRYKSFPCSQCTAPSCWMGAKPAAPLAQLHGKQIHCGHCKIPFTPIVGKQLYCSEPCRYARMMRRRQLRRNGKSLP